MVTEPVKSFSGCDGPPTTPMLAIFGKHVLVDGTPIEGESGLESTLNAKQELNALLGGEPIRDIVVQVEGKVPEARVARLLARAKNAGFVNVVRIANKQDSRPR